MSLVRIIGAEPLPLYPDGISDEMQKYLRDLHNFLRRLGGKFSGQNIVTTIEDETSEDFTGTVYTGEKPIGIVGETTINIAYECPLSRNAALRLTIQSSDVTAPIKINNDVPNEGKIELGYSLPIQESGGNATIVHDYGTQDPIGVTGGGKIYLQYDVDDFELVDGVLTIIGSGPPCKVVFKRNPEREILK